MSPFPTLSRSNRSRFFASSVLAATLVWLPIQSSAATPKPNIVLILTDDLGYGDLGCYGEGEGRTHGRIPTPHLDKLAREGMRFTDAHTAAAICTPARMGVILGRYPMRDGWQKGVLRDDDPSIVPAEAITLPRVLRAAGYRTMLAGKWHLGETRVDGTVAIGATTLGFERWTDAHAERAGTDDPVTRHRMADRWSLEAALAWLAERAADKAPFYFQFCPRRPHDPHIQEKDWVDRGAVGDYGDAVMNLDAHVGLLMAELDRLGLAKNTLVVVSSDNGPESSPHVYSQHPYLIPEDADDRIRVVARRTKFGHDSSGGWRGHKYQAYEGGHRVPFIVRWPGVTPAGSVNDRLLSLTDLLATFAAAAGSPSSLEKAVDSFDQSALLRDPSAPAVRSGGLFAAGNNETICVRRGSWTLLDGKKPELYDLATDPAQSRDLAADRPELVAELKAWRAQLEKNGRAAGSLLAESARP
jgi:arylsulfatase A-like enzyme